MSAPTDGRERETEADRGEALREMLDPPLVLASDDATRVAEWFTVRARRALRENAALRKALKKADEALIVLGGRTWEIHKDRPDRDDLYSWTVGRYRQMREAHEEIQEVLAEYGDEADE